MQSLCALLSDPGHDAYYFVDKNIVLAYVENNVPGLKEYVDNISSKGKRFFLTDRILKELKSISLPLPFHLYSCNTAMVLADRAYPVLLRDFACKSKKFETDVKWLLEAGFCLSECSDIPPEVFANDTAFALTGNANVVRKFLGTPGGRGKFEMVVNNYALEHLANIRKLNMVTGCYEDIIIVPTLASQ
jgi:hypothetical protein